MKNPLTFDEVLKSRRSIRDFSDRSVSQELIERVLLDALESPSSSNTQPFKVVVATGDVQKKIGVALTRRYRLSLSMSKQSLPKRLYTAYTHDLIPNKVYKTILGKYPREFQERRIKTGVGLYELLGIKRGDQQARDEYMASNFSFFNAPVTLWIFADPGMTYTALVDSGLFLQTLMLSATSHGLGTCAQGSLNLWRAPVDEYFDVPKSYALVCGVSMGYPTDNPINAYKPGKIGLSELLVKPKS